MTDVEIEKLHANGPHFHYHFNVLSDICNILAVLLMVFFQACHYTHCP